MIKLQVSTLETAAGQIPKPKVPDVDFDDPTEAGTVAEADITPNEQEDESSTTTEAEFLFMIQYLLHTVD